MSRTNAAETDYLELLFNNAAWPNVGDASGLQPSGVAGDFWVSLHTGDPGEAGDQGTNEATFGSYARQSVARSGAGWSVSGDTVSNVSAITFPEATSGSETITHVGIGTAETGPGNLLWYDALDSSRPVSTGITLEFAAGTLTVVAD